MTNRFTLVIAGLLSASHIAFSPAFAAEEDGFTALPAIEVSLEEYLWSARPIVVFADTEADPRFKQQMDMLEAEWQQLADRDVVVITDTAPDEESEIRMKLRPRGFQMTLVGKDGKVALRKPQPWTVREITRTIDKMPDREQEIRDRRLSQ